MKSDIARPDPIIYVYEAYFFNKKSKSGSEWVFRKGTEGLGLEI